MNINKKLSVFAAAFALIGLPVVSHAELTTHNHTGKYSTVITSDGICAGISGKFTGPNRPDLVTKDLEIRAVCLGKNPCTAKIIIAETEADVKRCNGSIIGEAILDTKKISIIGLTPTSTYPLNASETTPHSGILNQLDIG
jgi:hypothetical protein